MSSPAAWARTTGRPSANSSATVPAGLAPVAPAGAEVSVVAAAVVGDIVVGAIEVGAIEVGAIVDGAVDVTASGSGAAVVVASPPLEQAARPNTSTPISPSRVVANRRVVSTGGSLCRWLIMPAACLGAPVPLALISYEAASAHHEHEPVEDLRAGARRSAAGTPSEGLTTGSGGSPSGTVPTRGLRC